MAQIILEFGIPSKKRKAVLHAAGQLGIRVISVPSKDYGQTLGALAGIAGFTKEKKKLQETHISEEMLVFSGMNSQQLDAFLAKYKENGGEPIALKAVLTADNVFWSADKLFTELQKEHRQFAEGANRKE